MFTKGSVPLYCPLWHLSTCFRLSDLGWVLVKAPRPGEEFCLLFGFAKTDVSDYQPLRVRMLISSCIASVNDSFAY